VWKKQLMQLTYKLQSHIDVQLKISRRIKALSEIHHDPLSDCLMFDNVNIFREFTKLDKNSGKGIMKEQLSASSIIIIFAKVRTTCRVFGFIQCSGRAGVLVRKCRRPPDTRATFFSIRASASRRKTAATGCALLRPSMT
jgi:hypothetical protein